ncbi:uncharacterized protein TrAtP1_004893 [Trichoderma atroviride]|uniref:uncharacterized protein n=1 Tax=Hypocrea atroviridis TaxID=63577 RepID=UPI00332FC75F|nr:hypothetical protein TrAtP1_004893 [Trichoderma atroviride]
MENTIPVTVQRQLAKRAVLPFLHLTAHYLGIHCFVGSQFSAFVCHSSFSFLFSRPIALPTLSPSSPSCNLHHRNTSYLNWRRITTSTAISTLCMVWSLNNLPGDSTSASEAGLLMDANLTKESSKMAQNCQVSPTATEGDASPRKHSELTKDDASSSSTEMLESNHGQTSDNILTTPTTPQWFNELVAKKPTTPRLTSATNTQMATLQEEIKLLKQDLRKLQDQHQSLEDTIHILLETTKSMRQANSTLAATLSSNNNRVDMHDQMIEQLAARILALENQTQARTPADSEDDNA